jgi:hypothetical protein
VQRQYATACSSENFFPPHVAAVAPGERPEVAPEQAAVIPAVEKPEILSRIFGAQSARRHRRCCAGHAKFPPD